MQDYEKREAARKAARAEKQRDLKLLLAKLETLIDKAIAAEERVYHSGDLAELNKARHALAMVRSGSVRRIA